MIFLFPRMCSHELLEAVEAECERGCAVRAVVRIIDEPFINKVSIITIEVITM